MENPEVSATAPPLMPTAEASAGLQKILEEVAKKEDKWTKEQDDYLIGLVSGIKVENNMKEVCEKLNVFIDESKLRIP